MSVHLGKATPCGSQAAAARLWQLCHSQPHAAQQAQDPDRLLLARHSGPLVYDVSLPRRCEIPAQRMATSRSASTVTSLCVRRRQRLAAAAALLALRHHHSRPRHPLRQCGHLRPAAASRRDRPLARVERVTPRRPRPALLFLIYPIVTRRVSGLPCFTWDADEDGRMGYLIADVGSTAARPAHGASAPSQWCIAALPGRPLCRLCGAPRHRARKAIRSGRQR